jgi:malate/lactate dehydrogenase
VKVTLFGGAGGVGSSVTFNLLRTGGAHELVVIDSREHMVISHLMDLEQVRELAPGASVRKGCAEDLLDADIVVVCAAAPLTVNTSRMVYLEANAAIVRRLAALLGPGWQGILLMVTNPVDPLVTVFQEETGIERTRVLGYTLNDSLRLRTGIGSALGIDPGRVEAWAIGEHGDAVVPLFSRVSIDGEAAEISPQVREQALGFMRGWYRTHVALDSGRSSTWTSGLGVARMVLAVAEDSGELMPASLVLDGEYGAEDVSLSVPVTLGREGASAIHQWELAPDEETGLRAAAEAVHSAAGAAARVEPAHDPA